MATFATGAEQAESRAASSAFAGRAKYLSSETATKASPAFFRPFSEKHEWITVNVHQGIPTRPAPKGFKGTKWPEKMGAVCANDVAFRVRNADGSLVDPPQWEAPTDHHGHCWICENMGDQKTSFGKPLSKSSATVYGLVVMREPVRGPSSEIIGFKDKMEEFEDREGKKHQVPAIRVAAQKWSNFWGAINASAFVSGTVCNQDFMFTKAGTELEVTALGQTPDHHPGTASWKIYTDTVELMNLSLVEMVTEQSSAEYYARFFDPTKERPEQNSDGDAAQPDDAAPSAQASEDEINAFRERMAAARAGTGSGPEGS